MGAIYRTFGRGVVYRGRGTARTEHLTPDGRPFSSRAASKIRNRESGCAYAVDELVRRGAPRPADDDLRSWYDGLVGQGVLRRRRHPGHQVYAFALTQAAKLAGRDLPTGRFTSAAAPSWAATSPACRCSGERACGCYGRRVEIRG